MVDFCYLSRKMTKFARDMKRIGVCIALAAILMATACKRDGAGEATVSTTQNHVETRSDTLVYKVMGAPTTELRLAGIDSLEAAGAITPLRADYLRSDVYYKLDQPRFEEYYYKRALERKVTGNDDRDIRFTAAAARQVGRGGSAIVQQIPRHQVWQEP